MKVKVIVNIPDGRYCNKFRVCSFTRLTHVSCRVVRGKGFIGYNADYWCSLYEVPVISDEPDTKGKSLINKCDKCLSCKECKK